MKVEELMKELESKDPKAEVIFFDSYGDDYQIQAVGVDYDGKVFFAGDEGTMIDKKIKIKSCIRKYAITDRDLMNGGGAASTKGNKGLYFLCVKLGL